MTVSTLAALAANPPHIYRPNLLFVPLRFAIIFYSKILFIESTPTPPCPFMTDYLVSSLSFFVRRLSSVVRLLSSVVDPFP
jgi:hypothetical protein